MVIERGRGRDGEREGENGGEGKEGSGCCWVYVNMCRK